MAEGSLKGVGRWPSPSARRVGHDCSLLQGLHVLGVGYCLPLTIGKYGLGRPSSFHRI